MPSCLQFSPVETECITFFPQYAASHALPILVKTTTSIVSSIKKRRGKENKEERKEDKRKEEKGKEIGQSSLLFS